MTRALIEIKQKSKNITKTAVSSGTYIGLERRIGNFMKYCARRGSEIPTLDERLQARDLLVYWTSVWRTITGVYLPIPGIEPYDFEKFKDDLRLYIEEKVRVLKQISNEYKSGLEKERQQQLDNFSLQMIPETFPSGTSLDFSQKRLISEFFDEVLGIIFKGTDKSSFSGLPDLNHEVIDSDLKKMINEVMEEIWK